MSGNRTSRGSDGRLREMILYVLSRRKRRKTTVGWLLPFLYLADLEAYHRLGRTISGKTWYKRGSMPVPSRFGHVMARMVRDGDLALRERGA